MPYFGVKINISPVLLSGKHGSCENRNKMLMFFDIANCGSKIKKHRFLKENDEKIVGLHRAAIFHLKFLEPLAKS